MSQFLDVPSSPAPSALSSLLSSSTGSAGNTAPTGSDGAVAKKIVVLDDDSSDDDELPPEISVVDQISNLSVSSNGVTSNVDVDRRGVNGGEGGEGGEEEKEGPTLMEELMAEAEAEKKKAMAAKKKDEAKKAKAFGGGLKGGFFNSAGKKKGGKKKAADAVGKEAKKEAKKEDTVYELNADGEMVESIPTLSKSNTQPSKNPLILDDVQAAMSSADGLMREEKKWNNDTLMERIQKNPRLRLGLSNPKYLSAIEEMKADPIRAKKKYEKDKGVTDFITEFAAVMGEHFKEVGDKEEMEEKKKHQQQQQQQQQQQLQQNSAPPTMGPQLGPLAEGAVKREQERAKNPQVGWEEPDQKKVDEIVGNQHISSILMDPEMQRVLQECGEPGKMFKYMNDKVWGPKIKVLIDNGLIKVER
jgi:hypothetical protein